MSEPRLRLAITTRAIHPLHGVGGLERHAFDLVQHLLSAGVEVALVTRPPDGSATSDLPAHPRLSRTYVPYRTFPFAGRRGTTVLDRITAYPLFGERAGRAAAALVARRKVDVVYGLGASALGYARARADGAAAPFVFNPQGLEEFGATDPRRAGLKRLAYWPLQRAVRTCAAAADAVIATDRSLEDVVRAHLRVGADRVRLVPNAVDVERCDALAAPADGEDIRAAHGIAPGDFLIVSAGRIEENKGFHTLADALGRAEAMGSALPHRWRWVVVGGGPYRTTLDRHVARLGIAARVTMAGRVADRELHAWYEAASVFAHPTLYEGSSLVTLEAMAHRRAIVATRAGGLFDKVRPGVNGWLVDPGDPPALAAALAEAAADARRLEAMGAASRAIVEQEFSWHTVITRLLAVCEEVRHDRRPQR